MSGRKERGKFMENIDYREMTIEILNKINNQQFQEYIYWFVNGMLKKDKAAAEVKA